MLWQLKKLIKPKLRTLNTIIISKQAILQNLNLLQNLQPKSAFFPVLKSNAYGHGILPMLEILKGQNFPYLAVDSYPEYQLIHKHSDFNILLIGETLHENYHYFDFKRTTFAVATLGTLQTLAKLKKKIRIHLFLNTGMNREGFQSQDLAAVIACLQANPQLELEGVMSHLHSADQRKHESITMQIQQFKSMFSLIEQAGFSPKWRHIWASAGIFQLQDPFFTAFRPGLAMYGYSPLSDKEENWLQPALSLFSTIISLQTLTLGDGVSYNQQWKAQNPCRIATIPFGYYEGWSCKLAWKLKYHYQGVECPQVGTICMNLSSCLANEEMKIGDKIELISSQKRTSNSIEYITQWAETISYEVLIRLEKGIRRVVK